MGYRERYRHRRRMGYGPEKARRMAKRGCYIATSVYGSYDCPEVWTLRRFRDDKLATNFFGSLFIKMYYSISPALVKIFGSQKWFQCFWKKRLDKFVVHLNDAGFSDKPYIDKDTKWEVSSMRTRIYQTSRMKTGKRFVQSGTVSEWCVYGIVKWICKAIFYCMFFWIIIPVKLLKRK